MYFHIALIIAQQVSAQHEKGVMRMEGSPRRRTCDPYSSFHFIFLEPASSHYIFTPTPSHTNVEPIWIQNVLIFHLCYFMCITESNK